MDMAIKEKDEEAEMYVKHTFQHVTDCSPACSDSCTFFCTVTAQ